MKNATLIVTNVPQFYYMYAMIYIPGLYAVLYEIVLIRFLKENHIKEIISELNWNPKNVIIHVQYILVFYIDFEES